MPASGLRTTFEQFAMPPLFRCEQRHFSLPDGIAEQRAILAQLAQLCDTTLLEALDHHF